MKQESTTFERMSMTPIDIVCETEAPNAMYVRGLPSRWRTLRDFSIRMRTSIWLGQVFSKESTSWIKNENHLLGSLVDMIVINAMQVLLDRRLLSVLGIGWILKVEICRNLGGEICKKFQLNKPSIREVTAQTTGCSKFSLATRELWHYPRRESELMNLDRNNRENSSQSRSSKNRGNQLRQLEKRCRKSLLSRRIQ